MTDSLIDKNDSLFSCNSTKLNDDRIKEAASDSREQIQYDREWLRNERAYNRRQAAFRFATFFLFTFWVFTLLSFLVNAKIQREGNRDTPFVKLNYYSHASELSNGKDELTTTSPSTPIVLLIEPLKSGEVQGKIAEHDGLPVLPPELITRLFDKLFDNGISAVSSTADIISKFREAGIRIAEDSAKQLLAALLRPAATTSPSEKQSPSGTTSASTGSIQVLVNCSSTKPSNKNFPPTSAPKAKQRCEAPLPPVTDSKSQRAIP